MNVTIPSTPNEITMPVGTQPVRRPNRAAASCAQLAISWLAPSCGSKTASIISAASTKPGIAAQHGARSKRRAALASQATMEGVTWDTAIQAWRVVCKTPNAVRVRYAV